MTVPALSYDDALRVGKALCTRWAAITGQRPVALKDEQWADITQFILRRARMVVDENARNAEAEVSDAAQ